MDICTGLFNYVLSQKYENYKIMYNLTKCKIYFISTQSRTKELSSITVWFHNTLKIGLTLLYKHTTAFKDLNPQFLSHESTALTTKLGIPEDRCLLLIGCLVNNVNMHLDFFFQSRKMIHSLESGFSFVKSIMLYRENMI